MTDRNITAEQNSYPAQTGTWTLTAPDGRQWTGDSPIKCASKERNERIPAEVQLSRIAEAIEDSRRELFEKWARKNGMDDLRRDGDGYFYTGARQAWLAWCEALRS